MNKHSAELAQFIQDNNLKRPDGVIVFRAIVSFYRHAMLEHVMSEIQILSFPTEMAVYIIEFLNEDYRHTEMYNSNRYTFSIREKILEIRDPEKEKLYVSISPIVD